MIQNFRLLGSKDVESAYETIISNCSLANNNLVANLKKTNDISSQQNNYDNFDNFIEKRK